MTGMPMLTNGKDFGYGMGSGWEMKATPYNSYVERRNSAYCYVRCIAFSGREELHTSVESASPLVGPLRRSSWSQDVIGPSTNSVSDAAFNTLGRPGLPRRKRILISSEATMSRPI